MTFAWPSRKSVVLSPVLANWAKISLACSCPQLRCISGIRRRPEGDGLERLAAARPRLSSRNHLLKARRINPFAFFFPQGAEAAKAGNQCALFVRTLTTKKQANATPGNCKKNDNALVRFPGGPISSLVTGWWGIEHTGCALSPTIRDNHPLLIFRWDRCAWSTPLAKHNDPNEV